MNKRILQVHLKTFSTADVVNLVRNAVEHPATFVANCGVDFYESVSLSTEEHVAAEGQDTFSLRDTRFSGDDTLTVLVNGLLNKPGYDYTTINGSTVRFSYPLKAGARVTFYIWG